MTATATIKRGAARKKPAKPRNAKARAKPSGLLADLAAVLPVERRVIERAISYGLVGVIGVALIGIAIYAGVPRFIGTQIGQAVGRAGFSVRHIEIIGLDRMERDAVYFVATDQSSMAMPLVDLDKVRKQLLKFGWVEEAKVYRRLPDTLVVDVTERKPAAIWQHNRKLSLIDAKGVVLEAVNSEAMPDLPLMIGPNANREAVSLNQLLDRAPSLKPNLAAATWMGNRRWDLQFESGETLALPEGEEAAAKALLQFARMEGVERLLGRGFSRFDMRDPHKFVARIDRSKPSTGAGKAPAKSATEANTKPATGETENGPA